MGKLTRVLEKSGYDFDFGSYKEPEAEVKFELVEGAALGVEPAPAASDDVSTQYGGRRVIGGVGWDERLKKVVNISSELAESFRLLRSKILHPAGGGVPPRSIMVTSVLPGEGKSFVSANLGIALAQGVDQHSVLVDCDLRRPSLAKLFGVSDLLGLADYLLYERELVELIQKTSVENMSIITCGIPPGNQAELLGSVRMHDLVDELTSIYPDRFVVFDTPPLQVASESIVLSQVVDGVILVVRSGCSSRAMIERVISDIGAHKILGIIFNGHSPNILTKKYVNKSD
ncbi:MAG: protein-tyrosine kinase [Desulforhopalus sp.]|jgi:protein-tyrosine kinase